MGLTNVGRNIIAAAIIGDSYTAFSNANARIGVGDSNTAFDPTQTDLQAATNKVRQAMEATYPQRATNVITFRALFGTGSGNFAWQEWAIFDAAAAGNMLSRKVASLGTKNSSQSWQFDGVITVVAA